MKYLNKFKTYNDYLNHLDENTPVDCVNLENNNVHYSTLYKFDSDELCFYNIINEKKDDLPVRILGKNYEDIEDYTYNYTEPDIKSEIELWEYFTKNYYWLEKYPFGFLYEGPFIIPIIGKPLLQKDSNSQIYTTFKLLLPDNYTCETWVGVEEDVETATARIVVGESKLYDLSNNLIIISDSDYDENHNYIGSNARWRFFEDQERPRILEAIESGNYILPFKLELNRPVILNYAYVTDIFGVPYYGFELDESFPTYYKVTLYNEDNIPKYDPELLLEYSYSCSTTTLSDYNIEKDNFTYVASNDSFTLDIHGLDNKINVSILMGNNDITNSCKNLGSDIETRVTYTYYEITGITDNIKILLSLNE